MKFSKEHILELWESAPDMAPELINEIYEALEENGVSGVNTLFMTRGTFNPNFKERKDVLGFVATMKNFSRIMLTEEERNASNNGISKTPEH